MAGPGVCAGHFLVVGNQATAHWAAARTRSARVPQSDARGSQLNRRGSTVRDRYDVCCELDVRAVGWIVELDYTCEAATVHRGSGFA